MVHSNKNRLFEIMGKLDSSFKPKLNEGGGIKENQYYDSDPSDGDIDADNDSRANAEKLYDDGQAAFSKGDTGTANNLRQQALKVGSTLGWGDKDLPQYQTDNSSVHEELAVASDGGYYNKPERNIIVSKNEAEEIKNIANSMYNDLFGKNQSTVITPKDELKLEIIRELQKSGIQIDYDSEEQGADIYWISDKDINSAKEEFKSVIDNLYDKVQDNPIAEEIDPTQGKTNFSMRGKNRANPKYTHFAVLKDNGKIINGWDYKGYDPAELRAEKRHYFFNDITDMQINPKIVNVVTTKHLQKQGIDPFDFNNWNKNNDVYTM